MNVGYFVSDSVRSGSTTRKKQVVPDRVGYFGFAVVNLYNSVIRSVKRNVFRLLRINLFGFVPEFDIVDKKIIVPRTRINAREVQINRIDVFRLTIFRFVNSVEYVFRLYRNRLPFVRIFKHGKLFA